MPATLLLIPSTLNPAIVTWVTTRCFATDQALLSIGLVVMVVEECRVIQPGYLGSDILYQLHCTSPSY